MKKGIISLLVLTCALSACQKDVFDPNYNSELDARVPDNFEWSTTKTLTVNVDVKDEYNGKYYYAVRVYDEVPEEGVLPVAASGKVNQDMPFSQKIVVPATVSKLYIVQVFKNANTSEVVTQKEVAITGENIACSFGSSNGTRSVSTRAGETELKEGVTIEKQGDYYLNGEYTIGDINDDIKKVTITVNKGGKLNFSKTVTLPNQWKIDIKDGGNLTADTNTTITFEDGSKLYNYGEVHVYNITFQNGATLYNGDAMEGRNEGACFYANEILLVNGHGGDKRYLGERSYTSCEKLTLDNVELTLKTSAWLNCGTLLVTKNGNGKGGASELDGEGDESTNSDFVALATIKKIQLQNAGLDIEDDILVQCSDAPQDIKDEENVVDDATGLITIIGTTCSNGGFENDEQIELGTYTYIIEDMFPEQGDYDMNDIVVSMTATQKGSKLTIKGELKAVGASYAIIPYIAVNGDKKPLVSKDGKALEAHAILTNNETTSSFVNTVNDQPFYPAQPFVLEFDNIKTELNMNDIDFYIVVNNNEIHWNTKSQDGKATWGMQVPGSDFKWPQEKKSITKVCPEFTKWFENKDYPWYNNYDLNLIYNPK